MSLAYISYQEKMARIYDNIDIKFTDGLRGIIENTGVKRVDFCVGYFNLRGWNLIVEQVDKLPGGYVYEDDKRKMRYCRLLIGMHRPDEDLIRFGSLSRPMAEFLKEAVRSRRNILVSGGTGSGKTTLLNILSQFIPERERIITVEDSAELKLTHENLCRLEARPANIEGQGRITIRDLVINTLRMRPDRIIVGECRGAEALDMLQAMNTGHDGSMTTCHANNPRDALSRLENMVMMAGFELPSSAIREQIASAINLIVQQTRMPDGSRKIVEIAEVLPLENGEYRLRSLMRWETRSVAPDGTVTGGFLLGERPTFRNDAELLHLELPEYR